MNKNITLTIVALLGVVLIAFLYNKNQQNLNKYTTMLPEMPANSYVMPIQQRPQQPIEHQITPKTYAEALELAKKQNKSMFILFTSNSCGWCTKMKNETLNQPECQKALSSYVVYYVNANVEPAVTRRYQISAYPTYAIVTSQEQIVKKGIGYKSTSDFIQWLN